MYASTRNSEPNSWDQTKIIMITPAFFVDTLKTLGVSFYSGVPDSLLKSVCAYITDTIDSDHNIITANEGGAVALAAGHFLATREIPAVYMQNSGEGNIINPLASLTDKEVYNIPVLLIIGWRGQPGVKDEPQHIKQGKVTIPLLQALGINHTVLDKEENFARRQLLSAVEYMKMTHEPYALIIEKDTFSPYSLQKPGNNGFSLSREDAIRISASHIGENDVIVSTTGMISRELFEYRDEMHQGHERDFLTVGSMGHASQIALGIALSKRNRRVWCFDGDGAVIMHMGSMAIIGDKSPENIVHIIFNNGAHDSVGGQPTAGLRVDLPAIAKACRYKATYSASDRKELEKALNEIQHESGPVLLQVCVKKGNRPDLGRPTTTPIQNKLAFMSFLEK